MTLNDVWFVLAKRKGLATLRLEWYMRVKQAGLRPSFPKLSICRRSAISPRARCPMLFARAGEIID
jgi:hypothetical protein